MPGPRPTSRPTRVPEGAAVAEVPLLAGAHALVAALLVPRAERAQRGRVALGAVGRHAAGAEELTHRWAGARAVLRAGPERAPGSSWAGRRPWGLATRLAAHSLPGPPSSEWLWRGAEVVWIEEPHGQPLARSPKPPSHSLRDGELTTSKLFCSVVWEWEKPTLTPSVCLCGCLGERVSPEAPARAECACSQPERLASPLSPSLHHDPTQGGCSVNVPSSALTQMAGHFPLVPLTPKAARGRGRRHDWVVVQPGPEPMPTPPPTPTGE